MPSRSLLCGVFVLSSRLLLGGAPSAAADIFMLPAEPFYFLDTDDTSVRFKSCTVARVRSVTLIEKARGKWIGPDVVYELESVRTVLGQRHEVVMLLRGTYGYVTGNNQYEVGAGRQKIQGSFAPGDLVALPLEPDPGMTGDMPRNLGLPEGKYFRIEASPLSPPGHWPRNVAWSREFMAGLVRYTELREQASKLKEDRGGFWLKHLAPTEGDYVRMQAIWWLGQLKHKPAIPRIVLALTEGGEKHGLRMRRVAREALRKFPPEAYTGQLGLLATHSSAEVRRDVISHLALFVKDTEARAFCGRHMADPDAEVRIAALRVAARFGLMDIIEKCKSDESPAVREKAKAILAKKGPAQ
jgi:hypothetical protein